MKFIKFSVVGLGATAIDVLFFFAAVSIGLDEVLSRAISYLAGTSWAFLLNSLWVFRASLKIRLALQFLTVYSLTGLLSVSVQWLGTLWSSRPELTFAAYGTSVVLAACSNFGGLRFWVFRLESKNKSD